MICRCGSSIIIPEQRVQNVKCIFMFARLTWKHKNRIIEANHFLVIFETDFLSSVKQTISFSNSVVCKIIIQNETEINSYFFAKTKAKQLKKDIQYNLFMIKMGKACCLLCFDSLMVATRLERLCGLWREEWWERRC